ncbi:LysR family transcriptional regulator [Mycobacteroides franklinii]|uniref:LysR family transcriptional regulator n=1 Tax=Mycobacteroides franklinii TaxID=948102 RepID=UPI0039F69B61
MYDLRCFVAVAERLSFTQAARALCVSLPPLSRRIRDMENALQVRLFIRDTRHVELTRDGARLVPIARHILSLFDELPKVALESPVRSSARSVLCGIPPLLHPDLRKKLIDVEVCVEGSTFTALPQVSSQILVGVHRAELAFGLIRPPFNTLGLIGEVVHEEEMGAVLSRSEYGSRRSISVEELSRLSYVKSTGDSEVEFGRQFELNLVTAGIPRSTAPRDWKAASELITIGAGFTLAPLASFKSVKEHAPKQEVCLPIRGLDTSLVTCLVWRQDLPELDPELYESVRAARSILTTYYAHMLSS